MSPIPGLEKDVVIKNTTHLQQSYGPTTLRLNRSLTPEKKSSALAFVDPISVLAPDCFCSLSSSA